MALHRQRWTLRRHRCRFLLATVLSIFLYPCYLLTTLLLESIGPSVGDWQRAKPVGHRIRTPGCSVPQFDPFDPTVRSYFLSRSNGSRCHGKPNFLTFRCNDEMESLMSGVRQGHGIVGHEEGWQRSCVPVPHFNAAKVETSPIFKRAPLKPGSVQPNQRWNGSPTVLPEKLKDHGVIPEDVVCFYRGIYRNESFEIPDESYTYGPREPLLFDTPLTEEFLYVECATRQSPENRFHDQFLLNPLIKASVEERCRKAPSRPPHNLSVLLLVLDSVSYLNFDRHLPDTAQFLRDKLGAFQLHGYNKVGDNSFPNQVAFVTGFKDFEAASKAPDGFFDELTANFIWSQYGERGYRTLFLEEAPSYGIFNYLYHGFRHLPADYYVRHFIMATERSPNRTDDSLRVPCLGPTMPFEELLDYLVQFTAMIAERPFFACPIFIDITHNNLNSAGYADEPFRRFLEKLLISGVLNRTVLVFLSDHGFRFGDLRATYIGKFEDRQPFAFLVFPPWFLRHNAEAARSLHLNQRRLTTPFDIHATLVELLDYPILERPRTKYGLSLLHVIPDTRTCADASIPRQWCSCNIRSDLAVPKHVALSMADNLVSTINGMVARATRKCAKFYLLQVLDVTALQETANEHAANVSHYWVSVVLSPGRAIFEGTVSVHGDNMTLSSEVSRIDRYGPVTKCVRNKWFEKYCYCRTLTAELLASQA